MEDSQGRKTFYFRHDICQVPVGPSQRSQKRHKNTEFKAEEKGAIWRHSPEPYTHQPSPQPWERTEGHTQRTAAHGAGLGRDAKQRRTEVTREGGATEGGVGERTFQSRSDP